MFFQSNSRLTRALSSTNDHGRRVNRQTARSRVLDRMPARDHGLRLDAWGNIAISAATAIRAPLAIKALIVMSE
jgi:hypothetical protein